MPNLATVMCLLCWVLMVQGLINRYTYRLMVTFNDNHITVKSWYPIHYQNVIAPFQIANQY